MLTYNQAAFSFATVIYPLNGLDTEPRVGKPVEVEVAAWAASQGMGLGQQGLEPGSDSFVLQPLRAQYPKMFIQYQTNSAIGGEHLRSREISRLRKRMGLALSNGICEMQSIPLIKRFSPSGNTWLIVSMEVERLGGWFLTCMSAANQRAFHMVHAQCNSVSIENWEGSLTHVEASSWIRRNT